MPLYSVINLAFSVNNETKPNIVYFCTYQWPMWQIQCGKLVIHRINRRNGKEPQTITAQTTSHTTIVHTNNVKRNKLLLFLSMRVQRMNAGNQLQLKAFINVADDLLYFIATIPPIRFQLFVWFVLFSSLSLFDFDRLINSSASHSAFVCVCIAYFSCASSFFTSYSIVAHCSLWLQCDSHTFTHQLY